MGRNRDRKTTVPVSTPAGSDTVSSMPLTTVTVYSPSVASAVDPAYAMPLVLLLVTTPESHSSVVLAGVVLSCTTTRYDR
jgi:hypothetical protein